MSILGRALIPIASVKIQMGSGPIQSISVNADGQCEHNLNESDVVDWVF